MIEQRQIENLFQALTQNPEDWILHSVLADALEDAGKSFEADCLRWLGRNRKRPYAISKGNPENFWFDQSKINLNGFDPESDLPGELYEQLDGKTVANQKVYESYREAIEAVMVAWRKAVEGNWIPVNE